MRYIAVVIVVIIIGVLVGASIRNKHLAAVEPTMPPQVSVNEAPQTNAVAAATSPAAPASKTKTMEKDGVQIEVTKAGSGPAIKTGQTAVVSYTGMLTDGSVFDATSKHGGTPFEFKVGAGMVIKGWDIGVEGMQVGEVRKLTIPASLGYGANGYPPVIPANATLVFEVSLLGIK